MIRHYSGTYEGCDLVPLVTSSIGDSELIIHFQEAYARLYPNCYNKQGIQSNLPSHTSMNQGTICATVYPEGIPPVKGNNCGLIPMYKNYQDEQFYTNRIQKKVEYFKYVSQYCSKNSTI